MITFHKIGWSNFLSAGNTWTEIELDTHKNTLIMGHNGSGKSTFLDALTFALFGKPFRKVPKGNVVNSINGKKCAVKVVFTVGTKRYQVLRGVKPNIFEIYCDGVMVNQDAAVRDYQKYLEEHILKMNYKTFTQVVILGSASFVPFMQLTASDRRSVIEDLLDIGIFSAMSIVVKNKLQINRENLEKNRVRLTSKEENQSYIERTLESLKANNKEKLQELRKQKADYWTQAAEWFDKIEKGQAELEGLLDGLADQSALRAKHTKMVSLKSKIENNLDRVGQESKFYKENDNCPTCKQSIDHTFKNLALMENSKKSKQLAEGIVEIDNQITEVLESINRIELVLDQVNRTRQSVSTSKANHENYQRLLDQVTKQIEEFHLSDKTTQESERQLSEVKHDVSKLQKEKEALLDERQYIDLAATLLKDGGIKTKIIKQYLPIINKHINKYLSKMGFFVNFNIDESFNETIKSRYRDEFSYHNFSEGEKLRIDLAILLTWRQIAKLKNSVATNIIVFDEILDRAMDTEGIDAFMKLMWDMGEGTNVFVISHKDAMVDKFERNLRFTKIKNFSVLEKDA
jgi:DNA repair exonuclease SbcCD ATPase subunit